MTDAPGSKTETPETPPWGDDFNAETAWTLVQNLRRDKASLTTQRDEARTAQAAAETERDEAKAAADKATKDLASDRRESILKEFEIDEDDAEEFLSGDLTLDELRRKAERLAKRNAPAGPEKGDAEEPSPEGDPEGDPADGSGQAPEADPAPSLPARPKVKPTSGSGKPPAEPFDPDAIVSAIRRR